MQPMNLTELKAAMTTAGYKVSSGATWTPQDQAEYRDYCYHEWNGMVPDRDVFALAYPGLAPEDFPGAGGDTPVEPVLESIAITGDNTVDVGSTTNLTATGTYDDESTEDLTATATWASSDEEVATVDAGVVTGVAAGSANITATDGDVTSPAFAVTIAEPTIVSIAVTGTATVAEGATTTLTATATLSDSSTEDVTATATWTSSSEATATVAAGVVTGVAAGSTDITASVDAVDSPAFAVTVTAE